MFGRRVYVRSGISMYPEHPPIRAHHETLASILSNQYWPLRGNGMGIKDPILHTPAADSTQSH